MEATRRARSPAGRASSIRFLGPPILDAIAPAMAVLSSLGLPQRLAGGCVRDRADASVRVPDYLK